MTIKAEVSLNKENKISSVDLGGDLNKTDFAIIFVLNKEKLTMAELSKRVGIAPVNLWKHLNKLKSMGFVMIPKVRKGEKKYPELIKGNKTEMIIKFCNQILIPLKKSGGMIK